MFPNTAAFAVQLHYPTSTRAALVKLLLRLPKAMLLTLLLLSATSLTGCFESKVVTTKLVDEKQNPTRLMHGVFYALPRTIVQVDVPVVKIEIKDGIYKLYSPCFFPHEKVLDAKVSFAIDTESLNFDKLAIADPDQIFIIRTQGGGMWETRNLEMSLTESGVFVKGVAESTNESLDVLTSTVKDVVGIITKAATPALPLSGRVLNRKKLVEFRKTLTPIQDKCYQEVIQRVEQAERDLGLDEKSLTPNPAAARSPSPDKTRPNKVNKPKNQKSARGSVASPVSPVTPSPENPFADEDSSKPPQGSEEQEESPIDAARREAEAKKRTRLKELKEQIEKLNDMKQRSAAQQIELDDLKKEFATLKQRLIDLDADDDFRHAKEIYDKIRDLEEKRENLLAGGGFSNPLPAETLTKMLAELDATIKGYKAKFFIGTKEKTATILIFRMDPARSPSPKDLFMFSETGGICGLAEKDQGVIVDGDFKVEQKEGEDDPCRDAAKVELYVDRGDNGEGGTSNVPTMSSQIANQLVHLDQSGKRGFYYRIPGRGVARVVLAAKDKIELGRETLSIAQFGPTVSLPASTGGRRTKYTIELFEASGGLKNFLMGSDALVKQSNLKNITDSASSIVEAEGARREARRKANQPPDELSELERKRKILEEKKKIKELETALGTQSTAPEPL